MKDVPKRQATISARPRRLSEIEIKNQDKPIPEGTSFFIFSKDNWCVYYLL